MEFGSLKQQQSSLGGNCSICTQISEGKSPNAQQLEVTTANTSSQVEECVDGGQLSNQVKDASITETSVCCGDLHKGETKSSNSLIFSQISEGKGPTAQQLEVTTVNTSSQVEECVDGGQLSNQVKDASITETSVSCGDLHKGETKSSNRSGSGLNNRSSSAIARSYSLRSSDAKLHSVKPDEVTKTPEHANAASSQQGIGRGRGRKKKHETSTSFDGIARIRNRVKFLVSRIHYEHILIEAYSGEGWNGKSQEKVKPDKEIQRAVSDILKWKLKIRESFKELESLCSEGKHQESLFDSEGQIYSEDIFCAKCGSKEVSADNDIILCDGVCDRGFHQMCLEPPLLKIPPGDESWLCPGCSCKLELIMLLNDDQGTKLSIEDKWEKVFPEAAVSADGTHQSDDLGLPSDDSEDTDYDPDDPDPEEEKEDSSSDESDFTSNSSGSSCHKGSFKYQASDSSASEHAAPCTADSKRSRDGKPVADESEISSPAAWRRHVERLDYKKLYDEAYGGLSSDSSDDSDYVDTGTSESGEFDTSENNASTFDGAKIQGIGTSEKNISAYDSVKVQCVGNETEIKIPERKPRKKCMLPYEYSLSGVATPATLNGQKKRTREQLEVEGDQGSDLYTPRPRKFTLEASMRLCESLRENQYPTRQTKEKLASELGMEVKQIHKWFEHARRCIRGAVRVKSDLKEGSAASGHLENSTGGLSSLADGTGEKKTGSTDLVGGHTEECINDNMSDAVKRDQPITSHQNLMGIEGDINGIEGGFSAESTRT